MRGMLPKRPAQTTRCPPQVRRRWARRCRSRQRTVATGSPAEAWAPRRTPSRAERTRSPRSQCAWSECRPRARGGQRHSEARLTLSVRWPVGVRGGTRVRSALDLAGPVAWLVREDDAAPLLDAEIRVSGAAAGGDASTRRVALHRRLRTGKLVDVDHVVRAWSGAAGRRGGAIPVVRTGNVERSGRGRGGRRRGGRLCRRGCGRGRGSWRTARLLPARPEDEEGSEHSLHAAQRTRPA